MRVLTCITFDDICLRYMPLQKIKAFVQYLHDLSVPTTLFVVPKTPIRLKGEIKEYVECLKDAVTFGHELAQHGTTHDGTEYFSEFSSLIPLPYPSYSQQEKSITSGLEEFNKLLGLTPKSFRAPFYLHNSNTLMALANLGFSCDSSKTVFKPAHLSPVRLKVMSKLKPSKIGNIVEVPVTGDYTYLLKSMNFAVQMKKALDDFELVKSKEGVFVLNNHPNYVDLDILFAFLTEFIHRVSLKTKFVRIMDVKGLI